MWKHHFSSREYVNNKLVYRKPLTMYCTVFLLAFNVIALLLFGIGGISYYALLAFSPSFREKMISKYPNMIVKNKSGNGTCKWAARHSEEYEEFSDFTCIMFAFNGLIIFCYKAFTWVKLKVIKWNSELDMSKSSIISLRRKIYLHDETRDIAADTDAHISKLLSEENVAIFSNLKISHPNVVIKKLSRQEIHYNLKRFMFYETWKAMPGNMPPFIYIVAYMQDILSGIQYLHDCHIYHLNISPENILIVADVDNPSGTAKIANFHHAMHTDNYLVVKQKVGLDWIYR